MDTPNSPATIDAAQRPLESSVALPRESSPWGDVPALLIQLDASRAVAGQPPAGAGDAECSPTEPEVRSNQLIQVRLGIASSLFAALKAKDAATAAHSHRVAVYCSNWAKRHGLPNAERDALEVAALLHDVGKIGVPDRILLKPGALWQDEAAVMERHRQVGLEILQACCACDAVLHIVAHAPDWYNGSRGDGITCREKLPLGARMLAIVNAFDAMTTNQVYRSALSRERAVAELFRCAGSQFDPVLVQEFAELNAWDIDRLVQDVGQDWLRALAPPEVDERWRLRMPATSAIVPIDELFQRALPDEIPDAVIFIDAQLRIIEWNRGAERMTGIAGNSMCGRHWLPSAVAMRDERRKLVADHECPVVHALQTGHSWVRRMQIKGRSRRRLVVNAHVAPVVAADGSIAGVILLMHDVSPEISLESRCQSLHELATKDPLTQLANRAEFDRVLATFVVVHLDQQRPCSLIMSDIDHFKRVNDTFGHPAGDNVLKYVASTLRNSCRPGDLVARYGGEEFVVLCADCDNAAATRRAEEIRRKIASTPQAALDNSRITLSFGVTEIQPGDTPDTMIRRADRALYQAKDDGRDRVVQLGTGLALAEETPVFPAVSTELRQSDSAPEPAAAILRVPPDPSVLATANLVAWTPLAISIQKLQGFAADHHAEALFLNGNHVRLRLLDEPQVIGDHHGLPPVELSIDLQFREDVSAASEPESTTGPDVVRTRIQIMIRVVDHAGRGSEAIELSEQLIESLKAYLVAHDEPAAVDLA